MIWYRFHRVDCFLFFRVILVIREFKDPFMCIELFNFVDSFQLNQSLVKSFPVGSDSLFDYKCFTGLLLLGFFFFQIRKVKQTFRYSSGCSRMD